MQELSLLRHEIKIQVDEVWSWTLNVLGWNWVATDPMENLHNNIYLCVWLHHAVWYGPLGFGYEFGILSVSKGVKFRSLNEDMANSWGRKDT